MTASVVALLVDADNRGLILDAHAAADYTVHPGPTLANYTLVWDDLMRVEVVFRVAMDVSRALSAVVGPKGSEEIEDRAALARWADDGGPP